MEQELSGIWLEELSPSDTRPVARYGLQCGVLRLNQQKLTRRLSRDPRGPPHPRPSALNHLSILVDFNPKIGRLLLLKSCY